MFESNADLAAYVRQDDRSACEEQKSVALGNAHFVAAIFQFSYLFVLGIVVTRVFHFPWDIGGVISFVLAFVSFTPYFAFLLKEGRMKRND